MKLDVRQPGFGLYYVGDHHAVGRDLVRHLNVVEQPRAVKIAHVVVHSRRAEGIPGLHPDIAANHIVAHRRGTDVLEFDSHHVGRRQLARSGGQPGQKQHHSAQAQQ